MSRLVLHIGMHKTGTTALQDWLTARRAALARAGAATVAAGPTDNDLFLAFRTRAEAEHENIRRGVTTAAAAVRQASEIRDRYAAAFRAQRERTVIVSGEELSRLAGAEVVALKAFLDGFFGDIRVICFTRSPLGFATSYAQEAIKGGSTLAFERRAPLLPGYRSRLGPYISEFGRDRVTVLDYDGLSDTPTGCLRSFLAAAGLDPDELVRNPPLRRNEGLSHPAVELLSHINESVPVFLPQDGGGEALNPQRANIPLEWLQRIGGAPFGMPLAWQRDVLARSADDVEWLRVATGIDYQRGRPRPPPPRTPASRALLADVAALLHGAAFSAEQFLAEYLRCRLAAQSDPEGPGRSELQASLRRLRPHWVEEER